MARFRQVETSFWTDGFMLKLTPEEKYYYIYLLTNPHTTQCGIYELPERMAEVETGYNRETLEKLRERFVNKYKKIVYSEDTEEYCIVNWLKYNSLKSPKVKACIEKELKEVKDLSLIEYLYGIDSLSIDLGEEEEKEEEEEREEEKKKNNSRFTPPTLEEVTAYCQERNKGVDSQRWYDFYTAKGWMIGKNKMKDWKAAVRTWESKQDKVRDGNGTYSGDNKSGYDCSELYYQPSPGDDTEIPEGI